MKLSISNIAWDKEHDDEIREMLPRYRAQGVEVAPTKIWPDPTHVRGEAVTAYRQFWKERGISIPAMQALLFGHPELKLFEDDATRERTLAYLVRIMELGAGLGAVALVFGSPKNRLVGSLSRESASELAAAFFRRCGESAVRLGALLCIEPNPPQYGCDFVRTVREGVELVRVVNSKGFRLHLDASAMILNGEDYERAIDEAASYMAHFHISAPQLGPLMEYDADHRRMAAALRRCGWKGWVSIEMRADQTTSFRTAVERALQFANEVYLQ